MLSNIDIFQERQLQGLKTELIQDIEKSIFFDNFGRLRQNVKIKENKGSRYVGEIFCGKREGLGVFYFRNGDVYIGNWSMNKMEGECLYLY